MLEGGHEYDGRPIVPLRHRRHARGGTAHRDRRPALGGRLVDLLAARPELRDGARATSCAGDLPGRRRDLSHHLGRIGLLERENAALLNAVLHDLAVDTVAAFREGDPPKAASTRRSSSPRTTAR